MSLTHPPTLSFSHLRTPPAHGDVLVVPEPPEWATVVHANSKSLGCSTTPILGSTLGEWRRRTRMVVAGCDDRLLVVCGHQPAFIHPGVWAKHVMAARFAEAVDGLAINLVVDSDAPKTTLLPVATAQDGRPIARSIRFADLPPGHSYEQIPRRSEAQIVSFESALRTALGPRFDESQMPHFLRGMHGCPEPKDWVAQAVEGRRTIESAFGIRLDERRISECCPGPLLLDMILNAPRFVDSYNAALAAYRTAYGVRGSQRPIPDLHTEEGRYELPVWACRPGDVRHRFFVSHVGHVCRLFAEATPIGEINATTQETNDELRAVLGEWRLRPRALSLTLWARMLLADIFVHGIGGAKYDRISDRIMADYYGVTPPYMACVSATLRLDLPGSQQVPPNLSEMRHALRDFQYNPQRHLNHRSDLQPALASRERAVAHAATLRASRSKDRVERRRAFEEIRRISADIVRSAGPEFDRAQSSLRRAQSLVADALIARNREYFFGLFGDSALRRLLDALPQRCDFRV